MKEKECCTMQDEEQISALMSAGDVLPSWTGGQNSATYILSCVISGKHRNIPTTRVVQEAITELEKVFSPKYTGDDSDQDELASLIDNLNYAINPF